MERPEAPAALRVLLAVVIGAAVVGFFVGTRDPELGRESVLPEEAPRPAEGLAEAPRYDGLRGSARGDGPGWTTELAALLGLSPSRLDPVVRGQDLTGDLAARAARRAYDGAPPTIPHPIDQGGQPECLACHADGLRLRQAEAPAMSHTEHVNCTQCHVVAADPLPGDAAVLSVANSFDGLDAPRGGPRAWSIAPPQIPHTTWMRERCESCHGPNGRDALKSSHPSRESCTQCHTAPASLELRPPDTHP